MMSEPQQRQSDASFDAILAERIRRFEMIDEQMAAVLRQKTDAQRLRSVDAFWKSARAVLRAAIRTEHPDWDAQAVNREIARRISNGALENVPG